ncbi:MAG: hypothetical protein JXR78_05275 [Victivallales bacterium]|nr:hypothetical protein [Victivallales bacterium]
MIKRKKQREYQKGCSKVNGGIKSMTVLLLLSITLPLMAEFKEKPDSNTLWIENGKAISTSGKNYWITPFWRLNGLQVTGIKEGGFKIEPSGKSNAMSRIVPISKDYPWLVLELEKVDVKEDYNAIVIPSGIIITNDIPSATIVIQPEMKNNSLRMDFHGADFFVKSVSMVKTPDFYLETIKEKDGKVCFRVTGKRKVEDVVINFTENNGREVRLNGSSSLQLSVRKSNPLVWERIIDIESLSATTKSGLLARVSINGGGVTKPVLTCLRNLIGD